jgi:hypothetical protein
MCASITLGIWVNEILELVRQEAVEISCFCFFACGRTPLSSCEVRGGSNSGESAAGLLTSNGVDEKEEVKEELGVKAGKTEKFKVLVCGILKN